MLIPVTHACVHYVLDLNKLIKKIDKRIEKKSKKIPSNKKRRVVGGLSHHSSPPAGLPKWMLRPSTESHSEIRIAYILNTHILVHAGTINSVYIEQGTIDSVETVDVPGINTSIIAI